MPSLLSKKVAIGLPTIRTFQVPQCISLHRSQIFFFSLIISWLCSAKKSAVFSAYNFWLRSNVNDDNCNKMSWSHCQDCERLLDLAQAGSQQLVKQIESSPFLSSSDAKRNCNHTALVRNSSLDNCLGNEYCSSLCFESHAKWRENSTPRPPLRITSFPPSDFEQ